jgi:hypothetical protein
MRDWRDTKTRFIALALRSGVRSVAGAIPANKDTVYRLISGKVSTPSLAVRRGIERLVEEDEKHARKADGSRVSSDTNGSK